MFNVNVLTRHEDIVLKNTFAEKKSNFRTKTGKKGSVHYPKGFINEILSHLVQGFWKNGFGRTDGKTNGQTNGQTKRRLYARPRRG